MFRGFQENTRTFGDRLYPRTDTSRVGGIYTLGIVTDSLVLYLDAGLSTSYPGSGTTWTDLSGNGNDLTLVNSPTFTTSDGGYLSFNGANQYANRNSPVSTKIIEYSMCIFLRPSTLNTFGIAVHNGAERSGAANGYGLGIGNGSGGVGSKLQGIHNGLTWLDPGYTYPAANAWYYIVVARDAAGVTRWYVNTTQTANTSLATPATPSLNFSVGNWDPAQTNLANFAGGISIVQFYNKQLSQTEINQNYDIFRGRYGL